MKRIFCFVIIFASLFCTSAYGEGYLKDADVAIEAPSAVLMEKETGQLIYEKNAYERRFPASVTKIMTMLLIVEDIESGKLSLDDTVTASERAASFGAAACIWRWGSR